MIKLNQRLNQAVFLYDIAGEKKKALKILSREKDEALDDMAGWNIEEAEQIKMTLELMQKNIY